jgi:hypothetical protein
MSSTAMKRTFGGAAEAAADRRRNRPLAMENAFMEVRL